jgi:hypothetical protein
MSPQPVSVEKTTATTICSRCGSDSMEPGLLIEQLSIHFLPAKLRRPFWKPHAWTLPKIKVTARMCLTCGAIELSGDVAKARKLFKTARPPIKKTPVPEFEDFTD